MKKKMLQVFPDTHETIKRNAYKKGMTIEGYVKYLAEKDDKLILKEEN